MASSRRAALQPDQSAAYCCLTLGDQVLGNFCLPPRQANCRSKSFQQLRTFQEALASP
jgi:hypothetical protein